MSVYVSNASGGGEFGTLKAARDMAGRPVLIRHLPESVFTDLSLHVRAVQMSGRAMVVQSSHVAAVLGLGSSDGSPALAFETVEGWSLEDWVRVHGPYTWPEVVGFMRQIGEGLARLHASGLVHGNLASSNVRAPAQGFLKLTDPWLDASLAPESPPPDRGLYAPAGEPLSVAADLYSLGMLALEMLTGPFPADADPAALRDERVQRLLGRTGPQGLIGALLAAPEARPAPTTAFLDLLNASANLPDQPAARRNARRMGVFGKGPDDRPKGGPPPAPPSGRQQAASRRAASRRAASQRACRRSRPNLRLRRPTGGEPKPTATRHPLPPARGAMGRPVSPGFPSVP